MSESQLKAEVTIMLQNAASIGKSGQPYLDYCDRLAKSLMQSINKYKETEVKTVGQNEQETLTKS